MIKEELRKLIQEAVERLGFEAKEINLEHPENIEHGDYSTNVALVLAKKLGKNPYELAEAIASKLKSNQSIKTHDRTFSYFIEKIEVAGPGFINFFLSKEYFLREIEVICKEKEKYGSGKSKEKVIVEFTDPNPFKEFHIGHLYSNAVGEAISRIFEKNGAEVKRANYQGDVGLHVAKAIWGMDKIMQETQISFSQISKRPIKERIEFLAKSYAKGSKAFEENESAKAEIIALNKKIFDQEKEIKSLYEKGRKWSLEYFETIYKRLGTKFDYYFFESKVGDVGKSIIEEGLEKGIFQKSEGAIIFPGETYGLHSRVFINSLGLPTYEAKELGLAPEKYRKFKYDLSVIVTGNEINEYFKVLLCVMKQMYPELGEKTRHVSHGMVRLPEGKMSSRTGNVITGEQLLDEMKLRVLRIMSASGTEILEKEREKTAEMIAVGAVKYSLLRVSLGKDIVFDFDTSLSLEGDSGPYLQYTYARCQSIIRKAKLNPTRVDPLQGYKGSTFAREETDVLRVLYRFPEIVRDAAEKFSPSIAANFAFDLAQKYNLFYNTHSVLQAKTKELKEFRLALTSATAQILGNSLYLLGIPVPERM